MYETGRVVIPSRPAEQRRMAVIYCDYTPARKHGSCAGLRSSGYVSDVTVYDAKTMKPKRIENPTGEIIKEL